MSPNQIFTFQNQPVRVAGTPDNPMFVAVDVCRVLGIENSRDAVASLDADERMTVANPDGNPRAGIPHQHTCVTESGLFALVFKSRKPQARAFRKWVTAEVLPAIRKTGGYRQPGLPALDELELLLKAAREQQRRIDEVERLAIQANSYNSANTGFLTVRAFANVRGIRLPLSEARDLGQRAAELCRRRGLPMGRARDELYGEVNSYPADVLDQVSRCRIGGGK